MSVCIALIRGINVGKANRIAMADLKRLMSDLGHADVRTLLNSGNVVFRSKRPNAAKISSGIQAAITQSCGFSASVMVVTAGDLDSIIGENPLISIAKDPARHLVAFVADAKHLDPLRPLLKETWAPDALAMTQRAAYLWCSTGILESKMNLVFARKAGATITTRNWATVLKLQAAAKEAT
jgi:uncharacterized protein (DUF1697 family)